MFWNEICIRRGSTLYSLICGKNYAITSKCHNSYRELTLTHSLLSFSPLHKTAKIALFLWCTILANGAAMYEISSFTLEISCIKSKILNRTTQEYRTSKEVKFILKIFKANSGILFFWLKFDQLTSISIFHISYLHKVSKIKIKTKPLYYLKHLLI